jgi:hypothetical protein
MDAATRELLSIWTKLPADAQQRLLIAAQYEKKVLRPAPAEESAKPETELPAED